MGGNSSSGSPITKYVIPGIETVVGGVSEFFAPGNPIGVGLMGSGIGQLAGGAAGGSQGQNLGGLLGGLGGGALGGGGFLSGAGSGALGGSGDIGSMLDIGGTGAGAGVDQLPISMTQDGGINSSLMSAANTQALSQLMGGLNQMSQQPQTPPPQSPMAPSPRPMTSAIQTMGQQAATPHAQPPVQVPKPPAPPMTQPAMQPMQQTSNPVIAQLMKLLGGSA